jgi:photosystem II stability/assembly factor-like uncharacterized protein
VVWAVVRAVDGTRSLMDSAIEIDGFNDMTPSDARPGALAVDGNRVAVLDAHPTGSPRLYVSTTAGRSWTVANANGCGADFDGRIAAASGGLWLTCPTGTAAAVYPNPTSSGSSPLDTSALGGGSLPNNVLVAPRDASTAALGLDAEGIAVVSSAGKVLHRADVGGAPTWIGFSTPSTGYAIVSGPPDKQCAPGLDVLCHAALMRTTDGGATWKRVTFG